MILKDLIQKKFIVETVNRKFVEIDRCKIQKVKGIPVVIDLHKNYKTFEIRHRYDNSVDKILLVTDLYPCDTVELILNYYYFTYTDIIRMIFNDEISSSYETIGDVIHFNLKENLINYKFLIGKLAYDKTGHFVINKISKINTVYRFYEFEVIGGEFIDQYINTDLTKIKYKDKIYTFERNTKNCEMNLKPSIYVDSDKFKLFVEKYFSPNLVIKINELCARHIENGCTFHIDLKNVYWCSKLQEERKKLIKEIKSGESVCDIFCGLGPIVIPLVKKGCLVYCNDLNPFAIDCLRRNVKINKLQMPFVFNKDAKDFLWDVSSIRINHYILNLPEFSLDFIQYIPSGKIHAYFFCSENIEEYVKKKLNIEDVCIRFIRKVSPSKSVYKLTYTKEVKE